MPDYLGPVLQHGSGVSVHDSGEHRFFMPYSPESLLMSELALLSSHIAKLPSRTRAIVLCGGTAALAAAVGYCAGAISPMASYAGLLGLLVLGGCFAGIATLWSA